jgi:alpha-L-fucosidase 2
MRFITVLALVVLALLPWAYAEESAGDPEASMPVPQMAFSWPEFMARHDLVWSNLRGSSISGFMGNGSVGAEVIPAPEAQTLLWRLARQDAYAVKELDRGRRDIRRHGIGDFSITTAGAFVEGRMRQRLWDAAIDIELKTTAGSLTLTTFTHAQRDVIVIHLRATDGERDAAVQFKAFDGDVEVKTDGDMRIAVQPNDVSGDRTVVWSEASPAQGEKLILLSIGASPTAPSLDQAKAQVIEARKAGLAALEASHREVWHALYQRHFLSIGDTRLESLYWIGIHRLRSMFRPDGTISDNSGLWPGATVRWAWLTADMNAQNHHPALYPANLVDLSQPLVRTINNNLHYLNANMGRDSLCIGVGRTVTLDLLHPGQVRNMDLPRRTIADIPADLRAADLDPKLKGNYKPSGEALTNFGWLLHNYYLHYRMTMDEQIGRDLAKLLKLNMRGFLYMLDKEADGKYHLAGMYSPECGIYDRPDANYGLSMIQWACRTLLELDDRWKLNDPERAVWEDLLAHLVDYPQDENGFLIYPGVSTGNHRHWSHLLMIYPLYVVNTDQPQNRELVRKSIDFWVGKGMQKRAWAIAAGAAMYASVGDADQAQALLHRGMAGLGANTGYREAANLNETPLIFVRAIQDCMLQSWGGTIRVFPAVPADWGDVSIHNMRAEGAFSVSAARQGGKAQWIHITSHAGEPCRVRTDLPRPIEAVGGRAFTLKEIDENTIELDLRKGESVLLHTKGQTPDMQIKPAPSDGWTNWWGDRRRQP